MLGEGDLQGASGTTSRTPTTGYSQRQWGELAPTQVRLDQLVTTKRSSTWRPCSPRTRPTSATCSPTSCEWRGDIYLEDGLHRALRAALAAAPVLHARVLELPD